VKNITIFLLQKASAHFNMIEDAFVHSQMTITIGDKIYFVLHRNGMDFEITSVKTALKTRAQINKITT